MSRLHIHMRLYCTIVDKCHRHCHRTHGSIIMLYQRRRLATFIHLGYPDIHHKVAAAGPGNTGTCHAAIGPPPSLRHPPWLWVMAAFGQLTGAFVDGQTIGQLTGAFVDGKTIGHLTGEFADGQTDNRSMRTPPNPISP